jgi:hypothetical protein
MLTEDQARARLAQLKAQREKTIAEMNMHIGMLNGHIAALEEILQENVAPSKPDAPKAGRETAIVKAKAG